jgi:hypothetical protein
MTGERMRDRFMPWAGLALGTLGGGTAHQLGAYSIFQDCRFSSPLMVIVGTILGLALISAGAAGSWGVWSADAETPSRRMVAAVSLMASAIFAMAVVLPLIAALLIPRCWQ